MNREDSGERKTYRDAGVDITSGEHAKKRIGELVQQTYTEDVLGGFGHFGGMHRAPRGDGKVLVSSADSVGTKVLLAVHAGRHESIGVDLVNHSVNDILCCGARPLFFLDYFATSTLDDVVLNDLVGGMAAACREANCALIGGETAQLPGIYREDTYDLAGFIVGSVDEDKIIDGSAVEAGQAIIGLESNGLHTNGYSLAREVFGLTGDDSDAIRSRLDSNMTVLGESLGDALLRPHQLYIRALDELESISRPTALAHITGGGIAGNLSRVVPDGYTAVIDPASWPRPPIFELLQSEGNVSTREMFDVFNMGTGLLAVVPEAAADEVRRAVPGAHIIGEIRAAQPGDKRVIISGIDEQ